MTHPVEAEARVHHANGERVDIRVGNHTLVLDQPRDNCGEDAGPTPVDLFVAAVAACTAHYLRVACRKHGVDPTGMTVVAAGDPAPEPPARIGTIRLQATLPSIPDNMDESLRERLLRTARACYIARSFHQPPAITLELHGSEPVEHPGTHPVDH